MGVLPAERSAGRRSDRRARRGRRTRARRAHQPGALQERQHQEHASIAIAIRCRRWRFAAVRSCKPPAATASATSSRTIASRARSTSIVDAGRPTTIRPPRSRPRSISTNVQQEALLRFAAAPDARELRRRSSVASRAAARRQESFVSATDETADRLRGSSGGTTLDRTTLAIQGPPGAGKTYIGAQMIRALVRAGKRVGVTAGSHKVIRNLLDAVRTQERDAGAPLAAPDAGGQLRLDLDASTAHAGHRPRSQVRSRRGRRRRSARASRRIRQERGRAGRARVP